MPTTESAQKAPKKLFIKTYGCQMNVYDSVRMADVLRPMGYETTEQAEGADLVILNTCHIREKAEEKVYSDLGRIRREKERRKSEGGDMMIAVGGCVAQAEGEEVIRRAPFVDMVFGSQSYHLLPDIIMRSERERKSVVELEFPEIPKFDFLPQEVSASGKSAFLAVQEGCDKFCTFCVVPYTRGAEYSRSVMDLTREAEKLVEKGVVEIMLLGQNVNAYHGTGANGESWSLAQLIRHLAQIEGLKRIRYITSHPRDMRDDLIQAHGDVEKLMPYLHLPIQSGSDAILKKMNRKHTAAFYLNIIERLRAVRPDMAFSGDFIVGFPGETDQDFEDTMAVVRHVNYASAYSFKYSPRPGTPAAMDEAQVDEAVKDERLQRLQALLNQQQKAFNVACVGCEFDVLLEKDGKLEGQLLGKSPYMQSVHIIGPKSLCGSIVRTRIVSAGANSLAAELQSAKIDISSNVPPQRRESA